MKIVRFDERRESFPVWYSQFNALCAVKGVSEALKPGFDSQMPDKYDDPLDLTIAADKLKAEAKRKNALAMSFLALAMNSNQLLAKVEAAKSAEWPDGAACVLMAKLVAKYKPNDNLALAEQQKKLMSLKLNKNQDPEELGDKIAALESAYGTPIVEKHKVAAIVIAAGKDYGNVIREVTWRLEEAGKNVEADVLIEAMCSKWRICGECKSSSSDDDDNALGAEASLGTTAVFKGDCHACGKTGHRAKDCPDRGNSKCGLCGQRGHREHFCWEKEENASKRPSGWKSKLEKKSDSESAGTGVEVLLASIDGIKFGHSGNLAFGSGNSGLVTSGISGLVKSKLKF